MTFRGDPDPWSDLFPDYLVPEIVGQVLQVWEALPAPAPDDKEVPITQSLCVLLRKDKNRSRFPFRIELESSELSLATGEVVGRVDLHFSSGYREDVYFALECKRLNVRSAGGHRRSLAKAYVDDGIMRFVAEKYGRGLDKGGMLGYVMDGDVASAVAAVDAQVKKQRQRILLRGHGGLRSSSIMPQMDHIRETLHARSRRTRSILIHHLFLGVGGASS